MKALLALRSVGFCVGQRQMCLNVRWVSFFFMQQKFLCHSVVCFVFFTMNGNVRRYVLLAPLRGGTCFCTRGALQGYDCYLFILALAKTVTPGGSPRRQPGQAVAPATKPSSLVTQLSRHGAPMTYADLLCIVVLEHFGLKVRCYYDIYA